MFLHVTFDISKNYGSKDMVYFHISFSECFLSYCQPIVSTNFALKSHFVGFPLNITIKFAGLLTFLPMQASSQTTEHSTFHAISRQSIGGKAQKKNRDSSQAQSSSVCLSGLSQIACSRFSGDSLSIFRLSLLKFCERIP